MRTNSGHNYNIIENDSSSKPFTGAEESSANASKTSKSDGFTASTLFKIPTSFSFVGCYIRKVYQMSVNLSVNKVSSLP